MGHVKRKELLEKELENYPRTLSRDQVAEILELSRRTVDGLVEKKLIPSFTLDPEATRKNIKINKSDLILYMLDSKE